jgi:hypothetical protein
LGTDGIAFRMAVCDRVVGALVIRSRLKESEGPYVVEELAVLDEVTRSVADALFNLRANETAAFVRGVADGSIHGREAMQKAEVLCVNGLPGIDTSLHGRSARTLVAKKPAQLKAAPSAPREEPHPEAAAQ